MPDKPTYEELEQRVKELEGQVAHFISEREKLISTQTRLQSLINASPAMFYTCKPTDNYGTIYISRNVRERLGYQPQGFTEDPNFWMNNIHPEDRAQVRADLSRILSQLTERDHYSHEYRFRDKDGNYRWVHDEFKMMYNEEGNPLEIVGYWIDISDRKLAEAALKKSQAKYQDLYDNAPDMFVSVDAKTAKIIECNQKLVDQTGYTKNEIIGRLIFDMYTPESAEYAKKELFPMFATNGIIEGEELKLQRKDGSALSVSLNVSAMRDEKGNIFYSRSIWRDITIQKKNEKGLRKQRNRLQKQARRLDELNTALKIFIERREDEKKQLEEGILNNVKKTILPYIAKMEKSKIGENAAIYLEVIKSNLDDLVSPLVQTLSTSYIGLTQKEIEIAGLIKIGKTSKEIAEILNVSLNAVSVHRYKIRKKLNLLNKKVNLESCLQSLGDQKPAYK